MMKKFALKATVAAAAALASSLSFAAVDLDAGTGATRTYASELVITAPGLDLSAGAAADQVATVKVGASLAADKQAYVRFDLSNGAKFKTAPTLAGNGNDGAGGGAALVTAVAQGGAGESFVIFAVNPASGEFIDGAEALTLTGTGITVTNKNAVDLQYRLYETLTAAANPTNAASLALNSKSGTFLNFAPAVITTVTASTTETADVGATNAGVAAPFTQFTTGTTGTLGQVTIALASGTAPALATGISAQLDDILHATDNLVTVTGDFSWVTATNLANVTLGTGGGAISATSIAADKVTFKVSDAGVSAADIVATANGTTAIPVGKYTTAVDLVALNTTVEPTDTAATNSGEIVRNGTTLKFPALSSGKNTTTYLQLVNTGALNAPLSTECFLSDGTTVAGLSTTVPANTTYRNTLDKVCPTNTSKVQSAVLTLAVPSGNVNGTLMRKESTTGVMTYVNASAGNQ